MFGKVETPLKKIWFCYLQDRIKKEFVYFKLPRAHMFNSHAMRVLRGCDISWFTDHQHHRIRLCPRDASQSELCSEKTIDCKYGHLMPAAQVYLRGQGVAIRFDLCGVFSKLVYELV